MLRIWHIIFSLTRSKFGFYYFKDLYICCTQTIVYKFRNASTTNIRFALNHRYYLKFWLVWSISKQEKCFFDTVQMFQNQKWNLRICCFNLLIWFQCMFQNKHFMFILRHTERYMWVLLFKLMLHYWPLFYPSTLHINKRKNTTYIITNYFHKSKNGYSACNSHPSEGSTYRTDASIVPYSSKSPPPNSGKSQKILKSRVPRVKIG